MDSRWATHYECGRVLIIESHEGLCLIEADSGRHVVPISSLKFGALGRIIEALEVNTFAQDELEQLISILLVKSRHFKIPEHAQLWPGVRIELQLGALVRQATIKKSSGNNSYIAVVDGHDKSINITTKNILRVL